MMIELICGLLKKIIDLYNVPTVTYKDGTVLVYKKPFDKAVKNYFEGGR